MKGHLHRVNSVTCSRSVSPCKLRCQETFCKPTWLRWRRQTEKIAMLRPPPTSSDCKTFLRNQLNGNSFVYPKPRKQCLLNFFLPVGDFPFDTRFNVSFVLFMKILARDLKHQAIRRLDDNKIENRLSAWVEARKKAPLFVALMKTRRLRNFLLDCSVSLWKKVLIFNKKFRV